MPTKETVFQYVKKNYDTWWTAAAKSAGSSPLDRTNINTLTKFTSIVETYLNQNGYSLANAYFSTQFGEMKGRLGSALILFNQIGGAAAAADYSSSDAASDDEAYSGDAPISASASAPSDAARTIMDVALKRLDEAALIGEDNITFLEGNLDPFAAAYFLESLDDSQLLTDDNRRAANKHPDLFNVARVLKLLHGVGISSQKNFDVVIKHKNPKELADTLASELGSHAQLSVAPAQNLFDQTVAVLVQQHMKARLHDVDPSSSTNNNPGNKRPGL